MNIQTQKVAFVQDFSQLQNEEVVSRFEQLMKIEKKEVKPMTLQELNTRIDRSENDFKNNRFKTTEELLAKY